MDTALFAFRDPAAADRAIARLVAQGLPPDALSLHRHGPRDESETLTQLDEQVTGGAVRTLQHLFEGVMSWPTSLADPEVFKALMEAGGAVVAVHAAPGVDRAAVERTLQELGFDERTEWVATPAPARG